MQPGEQKLNTTIVAHGGVHPPHDSKPEKEKVRNLLSPSEQPSAPRAQRAERNLAALEECAFRRIGYTTREFAFNQKGRPLVCLVRLQLKIGRPAISIVGVDEGGWPLRWLIVNPHSLR